MNEREAMDALRFRIERLEGSPKHAELERRVRTIEILITSVREDLNGLFALTGGLAPDDATRAWMKQRAADAPPT